MFDLLERVGLDYERLPDWVIALSRQSFYLCTGHNQSWSSWAYATERRMLLWLLGPNHCRKCNEWHKRTY